MQKNKTPADYTLLIGQFSKYFVCEITLLKKIIDMGLLKDRAAEGCILLASSCTTGSAIINLGALPQYFYPEMMMLARSFIEKIVNYCYFLICSKEEHAKFLLHPWYKTYHSFDRSKKAGGKTVRILFSGKEELGKTKIINDALNCFSADNAKMNWSKKNIDEKIEQIAQKTKIVIEHFLLNTISIYSIASEALHGSLYGCSFHTGIYDLSINKSKEEVSTNLIENLALLYVQLGSMIHEVIKYLSLTHDLFLHLDDSEKNQKSALKLLKTLFREEENK